MLLRCLVLVGIATVVTNVGTSAYADEGYQGAVKAALRHANLTQESKGLLAAAREFDKDPSEGSLRALEAKMRKLQKSLDRTRGAISKVQRSLSNGEEQGASTDEKVRAKSYVMKTSNFLFAGAPARPVATPQVVATATATPQVPTYVNPGDFF